MRTRRIKVNNIWTWVSKAPLQADDDLNFFVAFFVSDCAFPTVRARSPNHGLALPRQLRSFLALLQLVARLSVQGPSRLGKVVCLNVFARRWRRRRRQLLLLRLPSLLIFRHQLPP